MRLLALLLLLLLPASASLADEPPAKLKLLLTTGPDAPQGPIDALGAGLARAGLSVEIRAISTRFDAAGSLGAARADLALVVAASAVQCMQADAGRPLLTATRFGETSYRAQVIAHKDSGIRAIGDLARRRWVFSDGASTSAYQIPRLLLQRAGVAVGEEQPTGSHHNTIQRIYEDRQAFGTTYWAADGRDARGRLVARHHDVFEVVRIVGLTPAIPNEALVVREGLPKAARERVRRAFLALARDARASAAIRELFTWSGFAPAQRADYERLQRLMNGSARPADYALTPAPPLAVRGSAALPLRLVAPGARPHPTVATQQAEGKTAAGLISGQVDLALTDLATARVGRLVAVSRRQRRLMALVRVSRLPRGLASLKPGARVALLPGDQPLALLQAYARAVGVPQARPLPGAAIPDTIDLLLTPEPAPYPADYRAPAGFAVVAFSPRYPARVAVVSPKLAPPALQHVYALVAGGQLGELSTDGILAARRWPAPASKR